MWFLLDVIIVVIFFIFAVDGSRKGLIKSVFGMGITLAAILIALNFSAPVAEYFRDSVVYEKLTDNLNHKVEEYVADTMDENALSELLNDAPVGISALLSGFGTGTDDVAEKYAEMVKNGETNIAAKLSDYIVAPAAKTLSDALAVLCVFLAALIVLNLAVMLLDLIFKLPVLHFANKLGGFVFGLVVGLLVSFVFCTVVHIALPYLGSAGIGIDETNAANAALFTKISEINPLSFLYSK